MKIREIFRIHVLVAGIALFCSCGGTLAPVEPVENTAELKVTYSETSTVVVPDILGSGASALVDFGDGSPAKAWSKGLSWRYDDGKKEHTVKVTAKKTTGVTFTDMIGVDTIDLSQFKLNDK